MRRNQWMTAIASAVLASACATTMPRPTGNLVESRAAVRVAEQSGADREPRAAQYLALARWQIADAERLITLGSNHTANRVLEEARVNAEVAGELARAASARAEAESTQQEIEQLRARAR